MVPEVSVVIPTHDRADLLAGAVESVRAQSLAPAEIIVVDDGSTDHTEQLITERFPDVRYIYQENQGVSAARNRGIEAGSGQWVAFLDSDDRWLPQKLASQLSLLERDPHMLCHTEERWIRRGTFVNPMKKHKKGGGDIYEASLALCLISPSAVLIRRDLFDEVGVFDEGLPACEDYDLWLRICARHRVLFVPEPLIVKYGGHDDQLSRRFVAMDRFRLHALEKMLESGILNPKQQAATVKVLQKKIRIFVNGARKRGKEREVRPYLDLAARWPQMER